MFKLRDYQIEAINIIDNYKNGQRILIALPTGSGKTVIFAQNAVTTKGRVLIVVPSSELREQTIDKLKATNPLLDVGSVQAKLDEVSNKVIVATRQSLTHERSTRMERMLEHGEFELIIFDEIHQAMDQVIKIVDKIDSKETKVVGFTATPYNPALTKLFDGIAYRKTILDMILNNYLCEPRALNIHTNTSLTNVKTTLGDFNQKQLEQAVNTEERNDLIVETYKKYASDRKATLVFCVGIEHSLQVAKEFNKQGIKCKSIDSKLDTVDRESILREFKNGELPVLCNVGVLTTGFDHPETDCIIMAKPTKSRTLYEQIIGRGLRLAEGKKDCLILDMVDVVKKHDLMSLSDVFGFEIKENETVKEAKKRVDKEEDDKKREYELREQQRQEELRLIAEQVALFNKQIANAFEDSYYDWFNVQGNIYCLSKSSSYHFIINKTSSNMFAIYDVYINGKERSMRLLEVEDDVIIAMERVETYYVKWHNSYSYKDISDDSWKSHNATENQLRYVPFKKGTKWDVHKYFTSSNIMKILKDRS